MNVHIQTPEEVAAAEQRIEEESERRMEQARAQLALRRLLQDGSVVRQAIRERLAVNHTAVRRLAADHPESTVLGVEGGWSAVLRVPSVVPEERLVLDLVERERVLVHPGYFFDFPHEAYLVVSLLPPPPVFHEGMARTFRAVAALEHAQ